MSRVVKLARNSTSLSISYLVRAVSNLLIAVFIARLAGVENLGLFSFVSSLIYFGIFQAGFGLPQLVTRDVAANPKLVGHYVSHGMLIALGSGAIAWLGLMIATSSLGYPRETVVAVGVAVGMLVVRSLSSLVTAAFDAFQRMELSTIVLTAQEVTALSLLLAVLALGSPFVLVFVALLGSRLVGLLVAVIIYQRVIGKFQLALDKDMTVNLLRRSWPYMGNALVATVYLRIDVLILNYFHGNAASGIYEAAVMLPLRLQNLALIFNRALLPSMAHDSQTAPDRVGLACGRSIEYLLILGLPITVGATLMADDLITFLYGAGYSAAVLPFQLLMTTVIIRFVTSSLAFTLTSVDRQVGRFWATFIAAVASIALGWLLIPSYGVIGATLSRVATMLAMFGAMFLFLHTQAHVGVRLRWGMLARLALATTLMAGTVWLMQAAPLWVVVPTAVLVFVVASGLLRVPEAEDWRQAQLVWQAFRNYMGQVQRVSR